jgi:hypothetical protein
MKMITKKSLQLSGTLFMTAFLVNCGSNNSTNSGPPADLTAGSGGVAQIVPPSYKLSQVRNFGVNSTDHLLHIELDGAFAGSDDVVTAACAANASPAVSIVSQSASKLSITMSPLSDSCTFSVQGASSSVKEVSLSSSAASLPSFHFEQISSPDEAGLVKSNFSAAQFEGDSTDSIFYSCDGADFKPLTVTEAYPFGFMSVSVAFPQPKNPLTCQFYFQHYGVQSEVISAYNISNSGWNNVPDSTNVRLSLSGNFSGSDDVVHLKCGGSAEQVFVGDQVYLDSATQIQIQVSAPTASVKCQVYAVSGALQSAAVAADFNVVPFMPPMIPNFPIGILPGPNALIAN